MSVAKVIELNSRSSESFEQAIADGIAKAAETVDNIEGAWVKEQKVKVENGQVVAYDVDLKITFLVS